MANDAVQNPANKWGRYSGAGPAGISQVVPTPAEARRGLQPFSTRHETSSPARAFALGLTAATGALVAAAIWRARQPNDLPTRVLRRFGMR